MNRLSSKIIAFILVLCMIFPIVPVWALAADDGNTEDAVSFKLEKISETKTEATLKLSITNGKVLCFDITLESDRGKCVFISSSSEIRDFLETSANGSIAANPETGKLSFADTEQLSAPVEIAEFKFEKDDADGIVASDFNLVVSSCYGKDENDQDIQKTANIINNIPEIHTHVASGVLVEIEPSTCLKPGSGVMYCSECGEIATQIEIAQKEHTIKEDILEPTCDTDGYIRKYCTVCLTEIEKTVLPKLEHKNAEAQHKDASCTEDGYDRLYCPDCGKYLNETVIPATNHANKIHQHKDATCTEDGYDRDYCPDCEKYLNETVIPATNHVNKVHQHKDATCTEDGYDRDYCPDCDQYINSVILPATNHKNTEILHKDATCTEDGYDRVYCKDCQKVISDVKIPATGHNKVVDKKDATCTEDGYYKEYCTKCNHVFSEIKYNKTGHQHTKNIITDATCTTDGKIDVVCSDCGNTVKTTVLKAEGHKWVNDQKSATCVSDGYIDIKCSKCKYVQSHMVIKASGHSWSEWQEVKPATSSSEGLARSVCRSCGLSKEKKLPIIVVPVEKIILTPSEDFTLHCKKKDKLQADVYPEDAAYTANIIFESSNPKVVSVDEDGNITALRRGTATITAKTADGKVSDSVKVTVEYSTIQWIIIYVLFGWIWYL